MEHFRHSFNTIFAITPRPPSQELVFCSHGLVRDLTPFSSTEPNVFLSRRRLRKTLDSGDENDSTLANNKEHGYKINMADEGVSFNLARVCETPGCNQPAKLQCPTCIKQGIPGSFFCKQVG